MGKPKKAKKEKFKGRDYDFDVNELFRIFSAAKELRDMIKTHKKLQPREFDAKLSKRQKKKMASEDFQQEIADIKEVMGEDAFGELAASEPHNSPAEFTLDAMDKKYSTQEDFPIKILPKKVNMIYEGFPETSEKDFEPTPQFDLNEEGANNYLLRNRHPENQTPVIPEPVWEVHPQAVQVITEKLSKRECEEKLSEFLNAYLES